MPAATDHMTGYEPRIAESIVPTSGTVSLRLGANSNDSLPTDERVSRYAEVRDSNSLHFTSSTDATC